VTPGRKLAAGRDADVFEIDGPDSGRVLRRYRNGRPSEREAEIMQQARAHGYPVPAVYDVRGIDMVMERVSGPTMLKDLGARPWTMLQHAKTLAQLNDEPLVTLSASSTSVPSGTQVEFTVDVQAADWVQFDSVEIHTDAPGRESVNGVANNTFVATTNALKKTYDPAMLPTDGGIVHVTETFTVNVTNSTWFVAVVRGTGASQPIDSLTGAKVFAVTNPIFVTAQ
jgi:hypothetical protein